MTIETISQVDLAMSLTGKKPEKKLKGPAARRTRPVSNTINYKKESSAVREKPQRGLLDGKKVGQGNPPYTEK